MEGTFDVTFGNQTVGSVQVRRQGLYYHYSCRCQNFTESMYDVYWGSYRLGLLIPQNGGLCLEGRLPVKTLAQESGGFYAKPRHAGMAGRFVALSPREPFSYLRNLENAYLENRNGQLGVVLKDLQ